MWRSRHRCFPRKWFSLKDAFLIILTFAALSVYIVYYISVLVGNHPREETNTLSVDSGIQNTIIGSLHQDLLSQDNQNTLKFMSIEVTKAYSRLELKLFEIESKWKQSNSLQPKVAVIRGDKDVMIRDLPIYGKVFYKHGFTVKVPNWYRLGPLVEKNGTFLFNNYTYYIQEDIQEFVPAEIENQMYNKEEFYDWSVILCMTFTDGDSSTCLSRNTFTKLKPFQKINRILGVKNILWRKDGFCYTMNTARRIPAVRKSQFAPLCFVLPYQYEQFLSVADALGYNSQWVLKSVSPGGSITLLQPLVDADYVQIKELRSKRAVVQQYLPNPLLIFGMPVSVRMFVLVSAIHPFRIHLHQEGIVHFRHSHHRGFKKVSGRVWLFSQLKEYIAHNYDLRAVETIITGIDQIIVQTLLVAESALLKYLESFSDTDSKKKYKCQHCFQLLGFDIILNSSFHPIVIEISGQPPMKDEGFPFNEVKENIMEDIVRLLFSSTPVALDISEALENCDLNIGIQDVSCEKSHDFCLTNEDLEWLLITRREELNRQGFRLLYPSHNGEKYGELLQDIDKLFLQQNVKIDDEFINSDERHNTSTLHRIATWVQHYCHNMDASQGSASKLSPSVWWSGSSRQEQEDDSYFENLMDGVLNDRQIGEKNYPSYRCSEDQLTMPYLLGIFNEPSLNLTPIFDPLITVYYANVSHDVVLIKMWGFAESCSCQARLEHKFGPARPTNYTLGLGENKVNLLVVDHTHTEPWVINTYTINIYRASLTDSEQPFQSNLTHQVCTLKQECDLQISPQEPCGLQQMVKLTWPDLLREITKLPSCNHGDVPGHWILPCLSCKNKNSCFWREARWQPYICRHDILPRKTIKQCFTGKKVLFIGDSTNRGIMHYLMEQLNGTLTEWDKTHHIIVYDNINNYQTQVSFAYYPQFWLPAQQRPVFDKALYQLIKRSQPLENSTNTVLVVGGVHWLATHHLNVLLSALSREGLQGIQLIMKSLGAGFHQPVDGVHSLTLQEQQKLLQHNQGLCEYAHQRGFHVIDTLNMTLARYKDFLQGKCACHFHKVITLNDANEVNPYQKLDISTTIWGQVKADQSPRYHVEGHLNALYSEILFTTVCYKNR